MSALTDRQKARERLSQVFQSILDKMIPADNSVPLEGSKFVEWEDQGDELARTVVPLFLEERAALDAAAQADMGGRCPHCGSTRVYLIKQVGQVEVLTPHGPDFGELSSSLSLRAEGSRAVVMKKQRGRCRACDRSFSPFG
jgi:DNA-directed RNA polymerase subunit RPC12/RpoP